MKDREAAIIGVPLDLGAENLGVDIGPNAFRYKHIEEKLRSCGFTMQDVGDIACHPRRSLEVGNPKLKYAEEIIRVAELAAKATEKLVRNKEIVVGLGGDHSVSLGLVSGASAASRGDLGLIYLDAHGDMNTDKTTMTGNIHGMHLASLMGFGHKSLVDVYRKGIKVKKEHLVHVGASDLDPAEIALMQKEKLQTFRLFDLLRYGLNPLIQMIDDLNKKVSNVWVSMDLDVIDSVYAPGAGMPNRGGLQYREIAAIAQYIGEHCNVIGVDVVEYNPLQDIDGKTVELGIELVAKFLGSDYSWYTSYMEKNKIG